MTVVNSARREDYTGDGVTDEFVAPFQFFELGVYVDDVLQPSNGTVYTITQDEPGNDGTVVFLTPPADGADISIRGATLLVQEADYVDNDDFPADVLERGLDRLTMIAQELSERIETETIDNTVAAAVAARDAAIVAKIAAETAQAAAELAETNAETAETNAETAETNAEAALALAIQWASKTDGIVDATDYAAKAWAIGGTGVTNGAGAAKEWAANPEDDLVDGVSYSSLHYSAKSEGFSNDAEGFRDATQVIHDATEVIRDAAEAFKDDAEAAALVAATYASPHFISINDDVAFSFTDEYGLSLFKSKTDGTFVVPDIEADLGTFDEVVTDRIGAAPNANGVLVSVTDEYGLAQARIMSDGRIISPAPALTGNWRYERDIVPNDGQSLETGSGATAITLSQRFNTKMLSSGVRTRTTGPYGAQTLVPLVEAASGGEGETTLSGMTETINELIAVENDLTYAQSGFELIGMAPGQGSTPIASHLSGSTIYTNAMAAIDQIIAISETDAKPVSVRTLGWGQGESDILAGTSRSTYTAQMLALRASWDADVKTKTGQTEDVQMLAWQVSDHSVYGVSAPTIALAQTDAADQDPNIHIICPTYMMDTVPADGVHLSAQDYRWLGAYRGLAYKRLIIDGVGWKPLRPLAKIVQDTACIIEFDVPVAPLVFDTEQVVDPGDYGFQLVDSGGSPLTISSVSLLGPTRVKIVASSTLPSGFKVRYAWGPGGTFNAGRITGPRGNLRDSAGLGLLSKTLTQPLHNWCLIFEL